MTSSWWKIIRIWVPIKSTFVNTSYTTTSAAPILSSVLFMFSCWYDLIGCLLAILIQITWVQGHSTLLVDKQAIYTLNWPRSNDACAKVKQYDYRGIYGQLIKQYLQMYWYETSAILGMMTSSDRNIFRVIGHLCGEFIGRRWIPRTKASDAELWCFLLSAPEWTIE